MTELPLGEEWDEYVEAVFAEGSQAFSDHSRFYRGEDHIHFRDKAGQGTINLYANSKGQKRGEEISGRPALIEGKEKTLGWWYVGEGDGGIGSNCISVHHVGLPKGTVEVRHSLAFPGNGEKVIVTLTFNKHGKLLSISMVNAGRGDKMAGMSYNSDATFGGSMSISLDDFARDVKDTICDPRLELKRYGDTGVKPRIVYLEYGSETGQLQPNLKGILSLPVQVDNTTANDLREIFKDTLKKAAFVN